MKQKFLSSLLRFSISMKVLDIIEKQENELKDRSVFTTNSLIFPPNYIYTSFLTLFLSFLVLLYSNIIDLK